MVLWLNKQLACGLNAVVKSVVVLCMGMSGHLWAQDTVSLNSVEVTAQKTILSQLGKKYELLDSAARRDFRFGSVADALSFNSPVFIKTYGPGAIATTAFRGGNASQTAVLWNGFNIQNAMLGQADLSLMPSFLFENIDVEYGGSSSLFGSGAVGGSIHLNTKNPFDRGVLTAVNLGAGSFGTKNASAKVLVSKKRFSSSTKLYGIYSDNNFNYYDQTTQEDRRQRNSSYQFYGLMHELKFRITPNQVVSVNAWLNKNRRRLPAFMPSMESNTWQWDDAARLTADWSLVKNRFKTTARAGFFTDVINYSDSLAASYSKSKVRTVIAESENYFHWQQNNALNIGVNFSSATGINTNYSGQKSTSRFSVLAGNKFSFMEGRLLAYISGRVEYFSVGSLPLTGNASLEYLLLKNLKAKINVARIYRQPTLNELYWLPGGNPDLKPEQGYTSEGELNYKKQMGNFLISVSGAVFSRQIENWILWVPGANGNPSPMNLQQVWSRGTETTSKLDYRRGKWNAGASVVSGYVLSTVEKEKQENSGTLDRQLIYTPRYTVNGRITAGYNGIQLTYYHQYLGYRFTASDNSEWIDPFHLSSLRVTYDIPLRKINLNLFFATNNLFNVNYTVLAGRPMPLRNYEFGISIQTLKGNNNHQ